MARQIRVTCNSQMAEIIIEALQWFVDSHYPHCADECSTAAREALLDLIARFQRELLVTGRSTYSSRVRAFVCEAIKGYTSLLEQQQGESYERRKTALISVCRGETEGGDFAALQAADRGGEGA